MAKIALHTLGHLIEEKRGGLGIRATAKKIGISPATLSRVQNGKMPDLETFRKICNWLEIDPGEMLGTRHTQHSPPLATVHFRKDDAVEQETAESLAELILHAQRALRAEKQLKGE